MKTRAILALAVGLLLAGCEDSKNPLSDAKTAKPDSRLGGVWRCREAGGDVTYYHVGQAGEKFPASVVRIVSVTHRQAAVDSSDECLAFPTVLAGQTYLNVVLDGDRKRVKPLNESGWAAGTVDCYTFFKYQVDGDKLTVWLVDEDAKQRAIKGGKLKGLIAPNEPDRFTDTTENVARFVAEAGDALFNTKEPIRLERVETPKKP